MAEKYGEDKGKSEEKSWLLSGFKLKSTAAVARADDEKKIKRITNEIESESCSEHNFIPSAVDLLNEPLSSLKWEFDHLIQQQKSAKNSTFETSAHDNKDDDDNDQQKWSDALLVQPVSHHLVVDGSTCEHKLRDSFQIQTNAVENSRSNNFNVDQNLAGLELENNSDSARAFQNIVSEAEDQASEKCKNDLLVSLIGDKTNTKLTGQGEKLSLSTASALDDDTDINKEKYFQCSSDLALSNTCKWLSDPNSKCLLFSHAKHSSGESKFSKPGGKLNHENINTPSGAQYKLATSVFGDRYSNKVETFEVDSSTQDKHIFQEGPNIFPKGLSHLKPDQSDLESYYTAPTDFGSDFCGFSTSSFVTCRESFSSIPRSRLTKAKDILIKGRNYVRAKLENYQKKFPRRQNTSKRRCIEEAKCSSCRFPCLFLGREISQISFGIPECSTAQGEDCHTEVKKKENNCKSNHGLSEICEVSGDMSENSGFETNQVTKSEGSKSKELAANPENGPELKRSKTSLKEGTKEGAGGSNSEKDHKMTVKLKGESTSKTAVGEEQSGVTKATVEEECQDDMPIGTEAHTIMRDHDTFKSENDPQQVPEQKPTNKRLRWVSAMDKTQSGSLNSSTTSNSSVEQFLTERETDPEKMLKSLGFGFNPDEDISYGRIPDRFLLNPSSAGGIDLYEFVLHHPDLHHLLWIWEKQGGAQSVSSYSNQSTGRKTDALGRQPTFSSLLHGMKFIQTAQSEAELNLPKQMENADSNVKDISKINSILDYPNRAFLASQGFYGKEYVSKEASGAKDNDQSTPKPVTAAQKRKQFHQSSKSRNWSLTYEPNGEDLTVSESTGSSGSSDHGLILRSFSEGLSISSESSLEGGDSFNEEDRRNSIRNLRRQYQETICQSIDGEFPVFPGKINADKDKIQSTSERRKMEVDRLMASLEDDGDYFAQSRQSSIKEVQIVKKRSQPSKDSIGSPMTPKMFNFSFEKDNTNQNEFQYSNPASPSDLKLTQEISIIVEDETDSKIENDIESEIRKDTKAPGLGLSPFELMNNRSDSSHTLVSQDSNFDVDSLSGDMTPRPGDVSPGVLEQSQIFINGRQICGEDLSESTSSSGTLSTMIISDTDQDQRSRSSSQVSMTTVGEPEFKGEQLKPVAACPPQESFELEEISSAENGIDDSLYRPGRRGVVEKNASFQSDSSGFADFESPGETSQSYLDLQQDGGRLGIVSSSHDKKTVSPPLYRHDNRNTHDAVHLLPVSKENQSDVRKFKDKLSKSSDNKRDVLVCSEADKFSHSSVCMPSLDSISYTRNSDKSENKSLVYTISVPYKVDGSRSLTQRQRIRSKRNYVSTMKVDVTVKPGNSEAETQNVFTAKGPVDYREIKYDLDPNQVDPLINTSSGENLQDRPILDLSGLTDIQESSAKVEFGEIFSEERKVQYGKLGQFPSNGGDNLLLGNRERSQYYENGLALKQKLFKKKKSKETLASAKSQMVDWLLSNQRQTTGSEDKLLSAKYDHPLSMSTPSLKIKKCSDRQLLNNQRSFERHSFDNPETLNDESPIGDRALKNQRNYDRNSFDSQDVLSANNSQSQSRASPVSGLEPFHYKSDIHKQIGHLPGALKHGDSLLSVDESVGMQKRLSLTGSSLGIPEEELGYLKLAKLVNGPTNLTGFSGHKTPMVQYRPSVPVKHWTDLHKTKYLEEETRLMQHAMQRYKSEMAVMETMLFNMCQLASSELNDEERADLEELQCLWSEVRKEIEKMEEHLSRRLTSVISGNDNFSTLNAMEIIQTMIDLLREQLYQQQLSLSRDVSFDEDDLDLSVQSPASSIPSVSMSEPILADVSNQMADIKQTLMRTQLQHQKDLSKSFSDLKEALVDEVRAEVNSNTSWLQLQLQSKDNEIQRLKTEMFLQNLRSGTTRKRQYFESDV